MEKRVDPVIAVIVVIALVPRLVGVLAALLATLLVASGVPPLRAQEEENVLYMVTGSVPGDKLGSALVTLEDIDGDGVRDFAAGAVQGTLRPVNVGYVFIASGATGEEIRTLWGTRRGEAFGGSLAVLGDVDGDGTGDLAISNAYGEIFIHALPGGERILTIDAAADVPTERSGKDVELAALGDVDGDGTPDLAYGDCRFVPEGADGSTGRLSVYSGATGRALWHRVGEHTVEGIGCAIVGVRDVDGDGLSDLATIRSDKSRAFAVLLLLRGVDGTELGTIGRELESPGFGYRVVDAGDVDGDGIGDFLTSGLFPSGSPRRGRGRVFLLSGADFSVMREFQGMDSESTATGFAGDVLGTTVASAGDMDGDGVPDLLLGTFRLSHALGGRRIWGRIYLRSGRTGALLSSFQWLNGFDWFVGELAPLGDADGDGRPEFLVASPFLPTEVPGSSVGQVRAITFDPARPTFLRGDVNADGRITVADAIALLDQIFERAEPSPCLLALDINDNGIINPSDAIDLLRFIFLGGDAPTPPFPDCGRYGGIRRRRIPCAVSTCTLDEAPRAQGEREH